MDASQLETGHATIDAQHRSMLVTADSLRKRVDAGDPAGAAIALAALWDETVAHFATEESLMEEHAYPERTAHRSAHTLFVQDLKSLGEELRGHGLTADVAARARQRVPDWIRFHIETNDLPFGRFLARRLAARLVAGARGEVPPPRRRDA
jgi:hemerythrin